MRSILVLLLAMLAGPAHAAITGAVMTTDGRALTGARVTLHAMEAPEATRARWLSASPERVPIAAAETDARGNFSLPSPKQPVVELQIAARGYEPLARVVASDDELGAIALTARDMRGGTVTAGGKPVPGALVVATYGLEHVIGRAELQTRTDGNGRFEVPAVKRPGVMLAVIHPDYVVDEEVLAPEPDLQRKIARGMAIRGRVVAADGTTPVAGATVFVGAWPLATSAEDGSFTITRSPMRGGTLHARKDALAGQYAGTGEEVIVRMERAATITGRVLDAKTNSPVAGAPVSVFRRRNEGTPMPMLAVSDARGIYSIAAGGGTYTVGAFHPAYTASSSGEVTAAAGRTAGRDLTLTPLARVSGVVLDEEKQPVVAALVFPERTPDPAPVPPIFLRERGALTAPDGRFSVRVLPDDEIRIVATKKGLPRASSDPMRLAAGERRSSLVLTIARGVTVTGRVLDPNGEPLGEVVVMPVETAPAGRASRGFSSPMHFDDDSAIRTAADGSFTLQLKEGLYDFVLQREGFVPKQVRAFAVTSAGPNAIEARLEPTVEIRGRVVRGGAGVAGVNIFASPSAARTTTAADGSFTLTGLAAGPAELTLRKESELLHERRSATAPARDVVLELPQGVTVRGKVVEKRSGRPVTSFRIGLSTARRGPGGASSGTPVQRDVTSGDGSFTLEHVRPGPVTIVTTARGYVPARLAIDLEEGKNVGDLVVELDTGVRLTGRVTGPTGAPLADASVRIHDEQGDVSHATTDAGGDYVIEGLERGERGVMVLHPRHVETVRNVKLEGRETRLDVRLEAGLRVTGTVVDESGLPVADAVVRAGGGSFESLREARTDASGMFEMERLTAARYRFTASKRGYADASIDNVDVGGGSPVRIVLKSGAVIYGRVSGLPEAQLAETMVQIMGGTSAGLQNLDATVDRQGNYRIEGVAPGTFSVRANTARHPVSEGRSSATQVVTVTAGGQHEVNLDFRGTVAIRGRVTHNGRPVSGARVSFTAMRGNRASASATADAQGNYGVDGLEDGEYSVHVSDSTDYSSYRTMYRVSGPAVFDIDYRSGALRGRVTDAASGDPIGEAAVQLRREPAPQVDPVRIDGITESNGVFVFTTVPPGTYVVAAAKPGFANESTPATVVEEGTNEVEIRMTRADGVTLRVVDPRGGRALRATAIAFDAQGRVVYDSTSAPRTRFSFADDVVRLPLLPGSYEVFVRSDGFAEGALSLVAPSAHTVALTQGGSIRVQSRHSIPRRIRLLDPRGRTYPRTSTFPSMRLHPGMLTLEHIAAGSYRLQLLRSDESVEAEVPVAVREGEMVDVTI